MAKKATGSVVNTSDYKYDRISVRGIDGKVRHSAGNGDAVAKAMLLLYTTKKTLEGVIRDNGLKMKADEFGGNAGTFRMSVGVALRGLVRNGTPVTIGDVVVKSLRQAVALPKVEKAERSAKPAKKAKKASKPRKARAPKAEPVESHPDQAVA